MMGLFTDCCNRTNRGVTPDEDDDLDFLAPSVYHLKTAFLEEITQAGFDSSSTIYDIEPMSATPGVIRGKGMEVKCPIDGKMGAAYVQCLEGDDHVGHATHMLSYTWGYQVGDIVETLDNYCTVNELDPKRTYVWICSLCNNQHRVLSQKAVPFEEFHFIFNKRVKGIGKILAMMAPWNDPTYLKRVWCIFEMYAASSDSQCSVEIVMPKREEDDLMNAIVQATDHSGRSGLDDLFEALANTKVEDAQASRETDKENIMKLVVEGPGASEMNIQVNQLMRKWIRNTVLDSVKKYEEKLEGSDASSKRECATFLTFCATFFSRVGAHKESLDLHGRGLELYKEIDIDESQELMARCYNNMGTEYESLGDFDKALEMHQNCREAFESIYGTEHENTSVSYFNIGAVLRKQGKLEEALEMYQKSLDIDTKLRGENHIDVASSYTHIGRIKQEKGDLDGAIEMFKKSLTIRENTFGKNHPDTAIGYGDVGLLHHMHGEYDDAIKMHQKALAIQESVLGKLHPDTASIYQNIGGAYYEKGDYKKALELHKKCKAALVSAFGLDHQKTKTSMEWISLCEDQIET